MIRELFADKLIVDDRQPAFTFDFNWNQSIYNIALFLPKFEFTKQMIILLLLQMFICSAISIIVYHGIIRRRHPLVGWGVVLPLTLGLPFAVVDYFDLRSRCLRMGLMPLAFLPSLKCLEAMYGHTPKYASASLGNLVLYFSSLLELKWDSQTNCPMTSTWQTCTYTLSRYIMYTVTLSILFSLLDPFRYEPWENRTESHKFHVSFEYSHLANNFVAALLMSLSLAYSLHGVSLLPQILFRCQTKEVVDNPMFCSTSPSDFWGRRWNKLVHSGLKRGVYKPVREFSSSRAFATFSAFAVSGALHEYTWLLLFLPNSHEKVGEYIPPFGKQFAFFGWNGFLIIIEYIVLGSTLVTFFTWIHKNLPTPIVGFLVVLTALPVGHWFTGDMIKLDYFHHMKLGFALVTIQQKS